MDPQACLARILDAIADRDKDTFDQGMIDLWHWVSNGGFPPTVDTLGDSPYSDGELFSITSYPHNVMIQTVNHHDVKNGFRIVRWSPSGRNMESYQLD
jgi:hypothetical protein